MGHFKGALRPPVDNFRSTEFGLAPPPDASNATAATAAGDAEPGRGEEEGEEGEETMDGGSHQAWEDLRSLKSPH